ncbi:MAG: hypothetical protein NVS9B4_00210 [Candidatus Acidiferrum sp.]
MTAWPHRPPLGATLALLASLVCGAAYCTATVWLLAPSQRAMLRVYAESGMRAAVPMPTFGHSGAGTHRFVMSDRSSITIAPVALYRHLREHVYGGRSMRALFLPAGIAWACTLLLLVALGAWWDRRHVQDSRDGRLIRGPRFVTAAQYNRESGGDGLKFEVL